MLDCSVDHNVIIQVGENQNIKEFRAHSNILIVRSPYFKDVFSTVFANKNDSIIKFEKPKIKLSVFEITLNCKKLQDHCIESICVNPQPFIISKEFLSLDNDILCELLKRDDLNVDEIVAWDYLIKWGIEQTPGLRCENKDQWNIKDYEALKETLNKVISLIRFYEINSVDFFDKVRPYKHIIPNSIYEEIMEFYMKNTIPKTIILTPRMNLKIDSKIIKRRIALTIINWIERKDSNAIRNRNDQLYNFELIYRGSKDGINTESCRNKCKLREPILVIIKCQNSQKIFGGYTPVGFYYHNIKINKSSRIIRATRADYQNKHYISSFIFSFDDDDTQNNIKLSRVISRNHAIYNNNSSDLYGFNFGSVLYMQNNHLHACSCSNSYYENNVSCRGTYTIEEVESFKLVKK
ncbi:hypothetical protein RclHR1_00330015 [Rhizophagus clarus]|uniref:BTB domain-containing protein n=1 Tax=Rhizophagus clarus TaxID=94130 RepID=A0A2Z6S3P9_9GLOM|nr:hypothetical protein RclHR1_00330015 [Rhizophagus clarus]